MFENPFLDIKQVGYNICLFFSKPNINSLSQSFSSCSLPKSRYYCQHAIRRSCSQNYIIIWGNRGAKIAPLKCRFILLLLEDVSCIAFDYALRDAAIYRVSRDLYWYGMSVTRRYTKIWKYKIPDWINTITSQVFLIGILTSFVFVFLRDESTNRNYSNIKILKIRLRIYRNNQIHSVPWHFFLNWLP